MKSFLDNNLRVIKEKHNEIVINEEIVDELSEKDVVIETGSYNGLMLRSQIDQSHAIETWCRQFDEIKSNMIVILFGLGSFEYLVEFRRQHPDNVIAVYEPSEEILYRNLTIDNYEKILSSDNIIFCVGEKKMETMLTVTSRLLSYTSLNQPFCAGIPNYNKIFEKEYAEFEEKIIGEFHNNSISRNTLMHFRKDRIINYIDNLYRMIYETTIDQLIESFNHHKEYKDYPAIIISAGPSLDKNIKDIADVKGRAFIVCVDAAVNTAINNNVRPDVIVSIDPDITEDSLKDSLGRELPLITSMVGSTALIGANTGRKYYSSGDAYTNYVLQLCNKSMPNMENGGSVSTFAFSLIKRLGFDKIILMGQDCGFPNNKLHAQDSFEGEEEADENDSRYFSVESIDGGKVLTRVDMDIYRKWFEEQIDLYPENVVVDATEGGALIKGTEILTIKDAIRKYCPTKRVDFEEAILSSDYLLDDEERHIVEDAINNTFEGIDDTLEYFNKVKRDYYKLGEINKKRKYSTKEFKRVFQIVSEHNKKMEEDKDLYVFTEYLGEKYFESIDKLKEVYDDEYEEIKNLVDQSIIMLDEYIRTAKEFKKCVEHKKTI